MRSASQVREVLRLHAEGAGASEIARLTYIPRSTVKEWIARGEERLARYAGPLCVCGEPEHAFAELPPVYAYLLGLYLGDGCLSRHRRDVYKLRIVLDRRYPGILGEARSAVAAVAPGRKVMTVWRQEGCVDIFAYWKAWPCVFPQHGAGPKHHRPIVLADWQEALVTRDPRLLLRGLIHSDGCRSVNTGTNWRWPRYSFSNRSADIRRIFCEACDLVGVRWTVAPNTVYVSRKADVARLDEFIGPKA